MGWIKTEDRLPDNYLLVLGFDSVWCAYYVGGYYPEYDKFYPEGGGNACQITHWMPLPPPPETTE